MNIRKGNEVINIDNNNYKRTEGMLYNYEKTKKEINNLQLQYEYIKNNYDGCKSITYEEKSSPTNKFSSSVENQIVTKEKMLQDLEKKINTRKFKIDTIDNAIDTLKDEKKKDLVKLRYIKNQGKLAWDEIAKQMYISKSRCFQIKDEVIKELTEMIFINEYSKFILKLE